MAFLRFSRSVRSMIAVLLLPALGEPCAADPARRKASPEELNVKAAFLLNFAAFVEWPAAAFPSPTSPIVLAVYGPDPFGDTLETIFGGETVRGRPFAIRRLPSGGDVSGCHIVFVAAAEGLHFANALAPLRGRPTLTVSDAPGFTRLGGVIEFTMERGRIRFRINQEAARASGLTIGSKLLRLATP
jgi:hypothetical protein